MTGLQTFTLQLAGYHTCTYCFPQGLDELQESFSRMWIAKCKPAQSTQMETKTFQHQAVCFSGDDLSCIYLYALQRPKCWVHVNTSQPFPKHQGILVINDPFLTRPHPQPNPFFPSCRPKLLCTGGSESARLLNFTSNSPQHLTLCVNYHTKDCSMNFSVYRMTSTILQQAIYKIHQHAHTRSTIFLKPLCMIPASQDLPTLAPSRQPCGVMMSWKQACSLIQW